MHPQRRSDGDRNSGGIPAAVGSRLLERAAAVKQQLGTYQSADSSTNSPVRNRGSGGSLSSSSSFGNSWALRSGSGGGGGSYGATGGGRADESDAEELAEIISRTPDLDKLFHGDGLPAGERDPNGPAISTTLQSSYGTINESGSDLSHMPASVGSVRDLQEKAAAGTVSASPSVSSALQRQKSLSAAMSPSMPSRSRRNSVGDGDYQSDGSGGGSGIGPEYAALLEELTNPVGRYRRVWLLIVFICVMYNAVAIPFALAFRAIWTDVHVLVVLGVLFYAGDLVFMLDCALYFYTPYTRDGLYERNLPDIRRNYLRSWFLIDFISSAPLDLLFIPFGLHAVLLARLTRFIRFIRLEGAFTVWEKYSTKAPQVVRFMKLMLALVLILHWLACFWWFCGITNGLGSTQWLPPAEFRHASVTSQYIVSLFGATNIVTQVGGDPGLPETDFERLSDVVVCFIAVFVVAVVIGTVTELVAELSVSENEMRHKLSGLNNFMDARRLPEELQDRIRSYYFSLWSRRGVDNDGSATILAELPSNLRTEVSLIMNKDIVGKVPIFQSSSSGFINALVLHLQPQTYMPKEVIVRQGDIGDSMFFISRGHVNVVADGKVVARIGEGGFFGEVAVSAHGNDEHSDGTKRNCNGCAFPALIAHFSFLAQAHLFCRLVFFLSLLPPHAGVPRQRLAHCVDPGRQLLRRVRADARRPRAAVPHLPRREGDHHARGRDQARQGSAAQSAVGPAAAGAGGLRRLQRPRARQPADRTVPAAGPEPHAAASQRGSDAQ